MSLTKGRYVQKLEQNTINGMGGKRENNLRDREPI